MLLDLIKAIPVSVFKRYPVKEIMVTGNIIQMLLNIVDVSEETIDFGCMNYPWMKVSGFTVSGK
jgi:predicted Zn-dependent protease